MRILSIDPGSRQTGFAVIEVKGKKLNYIDSGTLDFYQKEEFLNRLGEIHHLISDLVKEYQPDEIALESLIYVKSPTALMKLAQTRGAVISAFGTEYKNKIFEYSPNKVKSATTGHGHASKEEIQKSIKLILGVEKFRTHDESDALAVAICHAAHRGSVTKQMTELEKQSKKSLYKPKRGLGSSLAHAVRENGK